MRRLIQGGNSFSRVFEVGEPIAYLTRPPALVAGPGPFPTPAAARAPEPDPEPTPVPTPVAVARKVGKLLKGKR